MTLEELRQRLEAIVAEMEGLTSEAPDADLEGEPAERFAALVVEATEVRGSIERIESRQRQVAEVRAAATAVAGGAESARAERASAPTVIRTAGDPFDLSTLRYGAPASELRSRATTAVESMSWVGDAARAEVVRKMERVEDLRGVIPGLVLHTGSDAYQRGFAKGMAGRMELWTPEERQAMAAAQEFRAAMSLTDANGGYGIPFNLDPTIILTGDGSTNPWRTVCRVETGTTDTWNGLSSAGVTASWDGENAEVSDDSPTFAQPSATAKQAQAFVRGSIAITQDYRNLAGDLTEMFNQARDDLESVAFATGATGGNNPAGVIPLTIAYDTASSVKASATTDTYAIADVYALQNHLPSKYRGQGVFVMNNAVINLTRQFGTANAHSFLVTLAAGQPEVLLGRPLYESSAMDGTINASQENYIAVFGDLKRGFLIYDRVGMAVEFIPHLFATANNLPSGTRGWFAYWRVGSALLNGDAIAVLNVT